MLSKMYIVLELMLICLLRCTIYRRLNVFNHPYPILELELYLGVVIGYKSLMHDRISAHFISVSVECLPLPRRSPLQLRSAGDAR